ncbi:hypothetical protein GCM10027075_38160 [Streptomyces heilongjiangensis]
MNRNGYGKVKGEGLGGQRRPGVRSEAKGAPTGRVRGSTQGGAPCPEVAPHETVRRATARGETTCETTCGEAACGYSARRGRGRAALSRGPAAG